MNMRLALRAILLPLAGCVDLTGSNAPPVPRDQVVLFENVDEIFQHTGDIRSEATQEDELPTYDIAAIQRYVATQTSAPAAQAAPAGAPNIVVIVVDDMPRGLLGFEGNSRIRTPNLDRLRNSGIYFKNFYLPIGQCGPSRTILWTALLPTRSGVQTNGDLFARADTMVLPLWLWQHGYRTGFFGKCHIGTENPGSLKEDWLFDVIYHTEGESTDVDGLEDYYDSRVYLLKNASPPPEPGSTHLTKLLTDRAIAFIEESGDQPFFAWIAHRAPHQSSIVGARFDASWDRLRPPGEPRYRVEDMPYALSSTKGGDDLAGKPPQQRSAGSRYFYRRVAEELGVREYLRRAHEQMDYLDQQVGVLLDALQQANKLENTLLVFISDNGVFYGERGMEGKGPFNYDEITRVPLVLSWPGRLPGNVTRAALVQSTDLPATLISAAGLPPMTGTNGSSFWRVATGERGDAHRPSVFFQYHAQKSVVTPIRGVLKNGYKFSHYLGCRSFAEADGTDPWAVPMVTFSPLTFELYHLPADPDELSNLLPYRDLQPDALSQGLRDVALRPVLNDLLRTLAEFQTVAQDPTGLQLTDIDVMRTGEGSALATWNSTKNGSAVAASTEVVYRVQDCAGCPVYEVDHKHADRPDHEIVLVGLESQKAYELLLFSTNSSSNGGFARMLLPATVGQRAVPGAGSPFLSHIWQSFSTIVRSRTDPPEPASGACRITGANGGLIGEHLASRHVCIDDCRLRQASNPNRTCTWSGEIFHLAPISRCTILDSGGAQLLQSYLGYSECDRRCGELVRPGGACTWGAFTL